MPVLENPDFVSASTDGHSYRSFMLDHADYQQVDWEREVGQALEWGG